MNDLIYSVSTALDQAATPECGTLYGERIVQVVLAKSAITTTANVPTPSEIAASFESSLCTIIKGITNGHRTLLNEVEVDGEVLDTRYRINGNIRLHSEAVARMCERLTRYNLLYAYFVTDRDYCFGPYKVTPDFSLLLVEGSGNPVGMSFTLDYWGGGVDYSAYDSQYRDLFYVVEYRADMTTITADSTIITADRL
jgi:hypothetical protein